MYILNRVCWTVGEEILRNRKHPVYSVPKSARAGSIQIYTTFLFLKKVGGGGG